LYLNIPFAELQALLLPEWLTSLSVPQDPMVWMALLLPAWLISLSIPLDPMDWAGIVDA
jgi:hypothetical protein